MSHLLQHLERQRLNPSSDGKATGAKVIKKNVLQFEVTDQSLYEVSGTEAG